MAKLGILGLYSYDPTIFDDMIIPSENDITDEAEKIENPFIPDKGELIGSILLECAELELLYPDANTMKHAIDLWSRLHIDEWRSLYNTMLYRYNPIWNKDGTVTETRDLRGSDTRTPNLSTVDDFTVTNMRTDHGGSVTKNVTGYDTNTLLPSESSVQNTQDTTSGANKNARLETGTDKHDTTDAGTITRRETGNIGVTMTQEMIERQREVVRFNLYDYITKDFKRQFCLLIY